jgi:hypothetical protein
MKVKTILGVVIALTLVLSLSLTVMAGKPTPVLTVGSITYTVDGFTAGIDEIVVHNVSWQNVHPQFVKVYVQGPLGTTPKVGYSSQIAAPKGKAAKYPQDLTLNIRLGSDYFNIDGEVEVYVLLTKKNPTALANSGNLTTLTWGTSSNWTAP